MGAIGIPLRPQSWWLLPAIARNQRDVPEPAPSQQSWLLGDHTAGSDGDQGGGTQRSGRERVPGAQRCRSKHGAWENTVCRRRGTPSTTLRGPCLCTQLAKALCRGCLSPSPGQGGGWWDRPHPSLAPPRPGGSSGEGLGGDRGHSSLGRPSVPKPLQLLAGHAAEVAHRGTVTRGCPRSCRWRGEDALSTPQRCWEVLLSRVKEPVGGLAGSHGGHMAPWQGGTGGGGGGSGHPRASSACAAHRLLSGRARLYHR